MQRGHQGHKGNKPDFTHFCSLPFIKNSQREAIQKVQDMLLGRLSKIIDPSRLRTASNMLMHLTLGMLTLHSVQTKETAVKVYEQMRPEMEAELKHTNLTFSKISFFTRFSHQLKQKEVTVIYLEPEKDQALQKVRRAVDKILRRLVEVKIVKEEDFGPMHIKFNKFTERLQNNEMHLTLFRVQRGVLCDEAFEQIIAEAEKEIDNFRLQCDFIDISTRFNYDETKFYSPLTRIKLQSNV